MPLCNVLSLTGDPDVGPAPGVPGAWSGGAPEIELRCSLGEPVAGVLLAF